MSLSTYLLEYGRHVARLRRRRRRRAYAPTSNTASHDNHKKILHGFPFLSRDDYGAPLGGPSGRRSSAIILHTFFTRIRGGYYNASSGFGLWAKTLRGQKKLLLSFDIETIIESNTLRGVVPLLQRF